MKANNNRKMNKALKRIVAVCADAEVTDCQAREIAEDLAREALFAPPRNCDRFETETEMRGAFIDWYNEAFGLKGSKDAIDTCDLKHNIGDILHDYIEWLFAEAKGETE